MDADGVQFVRMLINVGYPQADQLNPSSFDWLFSEDSASQFLKRLCSSITKDNFLTAEELECYRDLESSGIVIADDVVLDEAITCMKNLDSSNKNVLPEDVDKEILILEKELNRLDENISSAKRQRDRLSMHLTRSNQSNSRLSVMEKITNVTEIRNQQESFQLNPKTNGSLKELSVNVKELEELFDDKLATEPVFLSYLRFDKYHDAERSFMKSLQQHIDKQLQTTDDVNQSDGRKSTSFLGVNSEMHLIKGRDENTYNKIYNEINRLRNLYQIYEHGRITLKIERKKYENIKNSLDQSVRAVKDKNPTSYAYSQSLLNENLETLNRRFEILTNNRLPKMLSECADARKNLILIVDYDRKISRQQYLISEQQTVIDLLLKQRARLEFLTIYSDVELKNHRKIFDVLSSIKKELNVDRSGLISRLGIDSNSEQLDTDVNDESNSTFLLGSRILKKDSVDVTYNETNKSVKDFCDEFDELTLNVNDKHQNHINHVCGTMQSQDTLENMLRGNEINVSSFDYDYNIVESPRDVVKFMVKVERGLSELERKIFSIMKNAESKQQVLKHESDIDVERNLFAKFFTDPRSLKDVVEEKVLSLKNEVSLSN